jgi:hypothetical protein
MAAFNFDAEGDIVAVDHDDVRIVRLIRAARKAVRGGGLNDLIVALRDLDR